MKKILIIAYNFPPDIVVHALRPLGLAKYLPHFGWKPIVLTARLAHGGRDALKKEMEIIEVPPFDISIFLRNPFGLSASVNLALDRNLSRRISFRSLLNHQLKTIFAFPSRNNGWYFPAIKAAENIISRTKIDCILSTSVPWICALIARRLRVKYGIPWIADAGDLWTQYHRYSYGPIRKYVETKLEKWTLKKANALVTVSEPRAQKWQSLHLEQKIVPITLCFDPDDFRYAKVNRQSNEFLITHAGKITERQNPEPLFKALAELIEEKKLQRDMIELRFWGPVPAWVKGLPTNYHIEDIVSFNDFIPRQDIIPRLLESHLLLLLNWNDPDERGVHPGKLFDYLGAKRTILAIGNYRDVITDVLDSTKAGVQFSGGAGLKTFLEKSVREFEKNGNIAYQGLTDRIEQYSCYSVAAQFSQVLNSTVSI